MNIKKCSLLLATLSISSIFCADRSRSDAEQKRSSNSTQCHFPEEDEDTNQMAQQRDLIWAAGQGNIDAVKSLVANKAFVNHDDTSGHLALTQASKFGRRDVVDFLLQQNADINMQDRDNRTALNAACQNESQNITELIKLLLENKAKTETIDSLGATPLFSACKQSNEHAAKLLIRHNADVGHAYDIIQIRNHSKSLKNDQTSFLYRMCHACYEEDVAKFREFPGQLKSMLIETFDDLKPYEMPHDITNLIVTYCGNPAIYSDPAKTSRMLQLEKCGRQKKFS